MTDDETNTRATLRDLLLEIRNGYSLFSPILILVHPDAMYNEESTTERTMTTNIQVDWADEYTREYANEEYVVVGSNSLQQGLDKPATIGRSRNCDVRVENESVSKVHASILLDRGSGGYFVIDQGSRNGTYLNGERVLARQRTSLWSGAYLSFGDAVYVFIDPPTLRKLARLAQVG
ncbi:MAG: FHA domain-containing protein [Myxococcales bacterium]|nr:FHA domain-containing protein [Myxococcales bacterium]